MVKKRYKQTIDNTVCAIHKFGGYAVLSNCFEYVYSFFDKVVSKEEKIRDNIIQKIQYKKIHY